MLLGLIITLAILSGQLIKLPIFSGSISILDMLVIVLSIYGLYKLKFKLKTPPLLIKTAIAFVSICIISLIFTPLKLGLTEYLNSFFYTIRFFFYILFAFVIYSKAFPILQKNLNKTLIYSGIGLSVLGLQQFIFLPDLMFLTKWGWDPHYLRTVSTFLDPNFAGAYFVLTLLLTFYLRDKVITKPKILYLFLTLTFFALLTTFSRSSYLMFLTSGLSLAIFKKSKKITALVLLSFAILLLGFNIYTQLVSKPRQIDREKSASFRLNTWQQGAHIFQISPLLGVGFNAYKYALGEYELGDTDFLKTHGATSNDSSLLFVAATTGVVGFSCYLYFIFTLFKSSSPILKSAILGLLIHSIFANSLFFPPILFWLLSISSNPKE